jgi:DinB superfamily
MAHPLVTQLRFTRNEWIRGLEAVTADEATRRFGALNPIAWMIGHLAWQEQAYWLQRAQGQTLIPEVERFGFGQPPSTPGLQEAWTAWRTITAAADPYLDSLTTESLQTRWKREPTTESIGTKLLRMTYHYWFHLGEAQAARQLLGHTGLPQFVGDISRAPYHPEWPPAADD